MLPTSSATWLMPTSRGIRRASLASRTGAGRRGAASISSVRLSGVYETVIYATDVPGAAAFYADVLGLRLVDGPDELAAAFRLDDGGVLLIFDPSRASVPGRPVPSHGATGAGHVAFSVE